MHKKKLGILQSVQNVTSLTEIQGYFRNHDFDLVKDLVQRHLVRSLHLAVFRRAEK